VVPEGPGRPANSLPTATHLLTVLEQYEKETDLISDELTIAEVKQRLSVVIVHDQLRKRESNRKYMKKWRTKNAK
tara:strand:- start:243 stop:467 length:225 start_codon:yes stop_codon:yes gene_type:complete